MIKESARTVKASKKTQSKHFRWSSTQTVLTSLFQDLCSILADQMDLAHTERTHRVELWTVLAELCFQQRNWTKYGKGLRDQVTADVLKELPPDCLVNWQDRCQKCVGT